MKRSLSSLDLVVTKNDRFLMTKSFLKGRHSSKWMIDEKTDIEQKQTVKNVKRKLYRKYTFEKLMSTLKHHVRTHTQQMFYEEIY